MTISDFIDFVLRKETVNIAIYAQLAVMGFVLVSISLLLWTRNRRVDYSAATADHFNQQIAYYISDEIDSIFFPESITREERKILRNCLISNIQFITGYERDMLVKKYEDFGFLAADIEKLKNAIPEVRLKAIIRLNILNQYFLAHHFHELLEDKNEYVATTAMVALSRLNHPLNQIDLLYKLPKKILKRQTILIEILTHFKNSMGFEAFNEVFTDKKHEEIRTVCLKIMSLARDEKSVSLIMDILDSSQNLPEEAICDVLPMLGKIADERVAVLNRRFIRNASGKVRAIALKNAHLIFDPEFEDIKKYLKNDTSFEVRKSMQEIEETKTAA